MTDKEKENLQNSPEQNKQPNQFSPVEDFSFEDLPDETPKVSIAKKKNAVLLIGFIVIFLVIMFTLFTKNQEKQAAKNVVKTELDEMRPENMPAGEKPRGGSTEVVSPSAASVGASPTINPLQARQQAQVQETLPPPPTLPPVVNPSSIYIRDIDNSSSPSLNAPPAASLDAFGQRYTRARERLPEVEPRQSVDLGLGGEGLSDIDSIDPQTQAALDSERQARINANMFVISGTDSGGQDGTAPVEDEYTLAESSAGFSEVGVRKDLERVILQGKVMEAVLETAINTDLPGKLRGIISRDVYSEDGRRVVIPKGSRLIGSYSTEVRFGQARVFVIWTRIIRPDGIDAVLDGSEDLIAVDSLGRTGVYGDLDNRFFEIFGSSILLSTLTVAFAVAADAAAGTDSTTTTTTNSSTIGAGASTTTTSDPVADGVRSAITKVGSDTANIASQMFNNTPRITVDQGTRIKIFVNKDILFPPSYFFSGNSNNGVQIMN
jgi:type IV secretion system protein VirB10